MNHRAMLIFTAEGPGRVIHIRGSEAWKLNPKRAREMEFCVFVQNRNGDDRLRLGASEPHGEAFLIGRVADVVPSSDGKRWRIVISDYARIRVPDLWGGRRFPIHYTTLEDLGISLERIKFNRLTVDKEDVNRGNDETARRRAAIQAMLQERDDGTRKKVTLEEVLAWRHEGHLY